MRVWVTVEVGHRSAKPEDLDEEVLIQLVREAEANDIVGWELPDWEEEP